MASTSDSLKMDPESIQPHAEDEEARLEKLGYKQEFERSYSLISLVSFGVAVLTPPTAIINTLNTPLEFGGPQGLVWGYIVVSFFTFFVALSMAEISAVYPVSGGPLSWAYQLAENKKVKVLASFYTGYFNIFAQIAFAASAAFQGVTGILAATSLQHPTYIAESYHYVLVSVGFIILFTATNIYLSHYHSKSTNFILGFNVISIVTILITLLATAPKRNDAKFIFTEYVNMSGFSSHGYVFILGLLQSAYTFTGYDAVTHLAEEANTGTYNVIPKAFMTVISSSLIYGFIAVVIICSTLTDITELVDSETGFAYTQLVYNCTQNIPATVFLTILPALAALFAAESMTLANSRTIYSFARDGAFIFPNFFAKVSGKYGVPIPALIFSCVIQCIIVILYLSSDVVFNTILSLCTIGHELAYVIPIALMLFGGRSRMPKTRPWNLGFFGAVINVVSVLWLCFVSITSMFPTLYPVTTGNMNYTVVIIFIVIAFASICYAVQGRKTFHGPSEVIDKEVIELDAASNDDVEEEHVSSSSQKQYMK